MIKIIKIKIRLTRSKSNDKEKSYVIFISYSLSKKFRKVTNFLLISDRSALTIRRRFTTPHKSYKITEKAK